MKQLFLIAYLLMLLTVQINAQVITGLDISIKFEKDTYSLFEPWNFTVIFKNSSNTALQIRRPYLTNGFTSHGAKINLELKNKKNELWVDTKSITNMCQSEKIYFHTIEPGEVIQQDFICPPPFQILELGENELRFSYNPFCFDTEDTSTYSSVIRLYIKGYSRIDYEAFNYLTKLPNPEFILFPLVHTAVDTSEIKYAEYIITHFPNSFLSKYANLNLCFLYLRKAYFISRKVEKIEVIECLRKTKKYGLLAFKDEDTVISNKARSGINMIMEALARLYYPEEEIPVELENEFFYIPK
jgi:hypothetical protein